MPKFKEGDIVEVKMHPGGKSASKYWGFIGKIVGNTKEDSVLYYKVKGIWGKRTRILKFTSGELEKI